MHLQTAPFMTGLGCRNTLVGTLWAVSPPLHEYVTKQSSHLVGPPLQCGQPRVLSIVHEHFSRCVHLLQTLARASKETAQCVANQVTRQFG